MVLVIAVLYHLRDELDCQYNANNTGDDTLYFPDKRGELLGSGRNSAVRDYPVVLNIDRACAPAPR